jgi:hypothetical protein
VRILHPLFFPLALGLAATGLSNEIRASTVIISVTGTVESGTDGNPNSNPPGAGRIFGGDADLSGKPFTLTVTADDGQGKNSFSTCADGAISQSSNQGSDVKAAPKAVLQIGNGSFSFGALTLQDIGWTFYREAHTSCTSYNDVGLSWSETYTGNYRGGAGFGGVELYASTANFSSGDWRSLVPTSSLPPTVFQFNVSVSQSGTPNPIAYAHGELKAATVMVSGPSPTCPAGVSNVRDRSAPASTQALAICPLQPAILRDGMTDITGIPQFVVVGQQISLIASLPAGAVPAGPEAWQVAGLTTGGFMVSPSPDDPETGEPRAADFTGATTVFYWLVPSQQGQSFAVKLSCILSTGQAATVQTTFTVDGPSSVPGDVRQATVTAATGRVTVANNILSFGASGITSDPAGVTFAAAAGLPSSDTGAFVWVQLVDEDENVITSRGEPQQICTTVSARGGPSLDNVFPYLTYSPNSAMDSPSYGLQPDETQVTRTFAAQMYLLWDPLLPAGCASQYSPRGSCTSIPIPLGSVSWRFTASATQDPVAHTWGASGSGSAGSFLPGSVYPRWSGRAVNGNEICKAFGRPTTQR